MRCRLSSLWIAKLIADETYFVVESSSDKSKTNLVGCGGWSKRKTLFGSDHSTWREDALLNAQQDAAKIRAFFIHPARACHRISSPILKTCEAAAKSAGFKRWRRPACRSNVQASLKRFEAWHRPENAKCVCVSRMRVVKLSASNLREYL